MCESYEYYLLQAKRLREAAKVADPGTGRKAPANKPAAKAPGMDRKPAATPELEEVPA